MGGKGREDLYKYKLVFHPVHTCPVKLEQRIKNRAEKRQAVDFAVLQTIRKENSDL
jgi:hypothetical protein